ELRREEGMNAAVAALRGTLDVKVEGENAFLLVVEANEAERAANIANAIPEAYTALALAERAEAAERAAAIFDAELERIRPQVEEFERKLTAFKAEHA